MALYDVPKLRVDRSGCSTWISRLYSFRPIPAHILDTMVSLPYLYTARAERRTAKNGRFRHLRPRSAHTARSDAIAVPQPLAGRSHRPMRPPKRENPAACASMGAAGRCSCATETMSVPMRDTASAPETLSLCLGGIASTPK